MSWGAGGVKVVSLDAICARVGLTTVANECVSALFLEHRLLGVLNNAMRPMLMPC